MQADINDHNDEDKIQDLNQDNHTVFNYLFNKYYSILCYFAENILHDSAAAEDVVEDLFVHFWKRNTNFKKI